MVQRREQLEAQEGKAVPVWTMDEHRLGLKPMVAREWFPWWQVPIAPVHWRFEWCWVYGFIEPSTGESEWWIFQRVNTEIFSRILGAFAIAQGIDKQHPALLVLDQARWHTTKKLEIPEGLFLEFLPPYSPELQPAERLWPILDEGVINRVFETFDELEEAIIRRCRQLIEQPLLLKAFTQFHWWPTSSTCTF